MRFKSLIGTLAFAAGALVFSSANAGFEQCKNMFAGGQPPTLEQGPGKLRELCFDGFAVLHSGVSKTPVYVAERLNRASLTAGKGLKRTDRFYEEARLPHAERAKLSDYKSGRVEQDGKVVAENLRFDRGHMAPAADSATENAMAQSFSLANMVPQAPQHNRGIWADFEKATRQYVNRAKGDVYVITGPFYAQPVAKLGPGKVWVPTALFKLVYDAQSGRAWAHWSENRDDARAGKPISYEELVRRTGIQFLPGLQQ